MSCCECASAKKEKLKDFAGEIFVGRAQLALFKIKAVGHLGCARECLGKVRRQAELELAKSVLNWANEHGVLHQLMADYADVAKDSTHFSSSAFSNSEKNRSHLRLRS